MIPDNASPPRITAAAGTELAGAFSAGTVIITPCSNVTYSSLLTAVYTPKSFIGHAAWLRQAFAHCAIFLTAASRRSLGRISVPVWLIILSDQLTIVALVSRYLTNKLMVRKLIPKRPKALIQFSCGNWTICGISPPFGGLFPTSGQITYVLLTRSPLY